jgi:hypothetical protein
MIARMYRGGIRTAAPWVGTAVGSGLMIVSVLCMAPWEVGRCGHLLQAMRDPLGIELQCFEPLEHRWRIAWALWFSGLCLIVSMAITLWRRHHPFPGLFFSLTTNLLAVGIPVGILGIVVLVVGNRQIAYVP